MADIVIKCPTFGTAVPTGITTEMIIFDTLDFPLTVHCPDCRQIHTWTRSNAWIAKERQATAGPDFSPCRLGAIRHCGKRGTCSS
jgi:hypothetical protein